VTTSAETETGNSNKLSGQYQPVSADAFQDKFIPQEAVFVCSQQIELLQKEQYLTLTFNRTTIQKPESFYTAHATVAGPPHQAYFLDGHKGTGEHHDKKWIVEKLQNVSTILYVIYQILINDLLQ
jgi:hypothetical protein